MFRAARAGLCTLWAVLAPAVGFCQPDVSISYLSEFGTGGSEAGQFGTLRGITIGNNGEVILADAGNERIQVCDMAGECFAFGQPGRPLGYFDNPHGVAVDSAGRIMTIETGNPRVQIFSPEGEFLQVFGSDGTAPGQFRVPAGIWIDPQDRILIADEANDRIQICNDSGTCTVALGTGTSGTEPGEFTFPRGVAMDEEGRILVSELLGHRVSICQEQGACTFFGGPEPGNGPGEFDHPRELIPDGFGNIIIADGANHRLQICDYQGQCTAFGEAGMGPGQFLTPIGVAMDQQGRLYVADQSNDRVQVFRYTVGFQVNAGLNDAWFNPQTAGQGFFITVFPDLERMFLAWFTYDTERPAQDVEAILGEPGHRWLTAFGPYSGTTALLDIELTRGGVFDMTLPVPTQSPDGSIVLEFEGCNAATVSYDISSANLQGEVPIERIALDNVPACEGL
jgi:DNA-binding beta-propeller fold protein YncE